MSLADDRELLISRQASDLDGAGSFVNRSGRGIAARRPVRLGPVSRVFGEHSENPNGTYGFSALSKARQS